MKLNIEQIRKITRGAVRIEDEVDGVHFYRFTKAQEELYKNVSNDFFRKTHATAGVRIEFLTDSKTLEIKTNVSSGSSRTYFAFEVFVNGQLNGYLANFNEDDVTEDYISAEYEQGKFSKTFSLGVGEKTVSLGWNNATHSYLQPGSTLKPITAFAPALEIGMITHSGAAVESTI